MIGASHFQKKMIEKIDFSMSCHRNNKFLDYNTNWTTNDYTTWLQIVFYLIDYNLQLDHTTILQLTAKLTYMTIHKLVDTTSLIDEHQMMIDYKSGYKLTSTWMAYIPIID